VFNISIFYDSYYRMEAFLLIMKIEKHLSKTNVQQFYIMKKKDFFIFPRFLRIFNCSKKLAGNKNTPNFITYKDYI